MQPTIPRRRKSSCAWPLSYRPCMSEQDTHRTRKTGPYLGRLFDSSAVSPSGSNSLAGYAPAYEMINHYTHNREHEATYRRRLGWRPSKRTVIRFVPVPEDIMRHTTRRITNAASGLEVRHCGRSRGCWDGLKWRTVSSFLDPVRSQGLLLPYQKDQGMCQQSSVHRSLHRKSSQSVRSLSKRREVSMMGQRKMDQVGWQGAYGEASGCW